MRFRSYSCTVLGSLLLTCSLYGQTDNAALIEHLGEFYAEDRDENFDFTELAERLEFYRQHPIDLNRTDGSELRELLFVPELFIGNLLAHRHASGRLVSVYELQAIEGMDLELLRMLIPFVEVNTPGSLSEVRARELLSEGAHDLMVRYGRMLQRQRGYAIRDTARSRYLGSPDRMFVRYRYHFNRDLRVAVNMKKDAGERFFSGAQRQGFDFYSGSVYMRNQGHVRDLVIGDYALQFGQGLAMWSGLGFGKGATLQQVAKQGTGLRPYTSSNEVLFLRGAAATIALKPNLSVTPFVSWRKLDGSMEHAADSTQLVGSLGQTGLHRTPSEAANRNALQQWVYGLNIQYARRRFTLGATAFRTEFDASIKPRPRLYTRYAFRGRSLWNASLYYSGTVRNVYFFGEAAHRIGRGFAFLNGAMLNLHHRLSLVLLHRDFHREYHSFYNQAFAAGSAAVNERGFYSGLAYQLGRRVQWVGYVDVFRFPWLRYRVNAPSGGMDMLTQFTYEWYKRAKASIRYRYRRKAENAALDLPENRVVDVNRQQLRIDGQYTLDDRWRMRSRVEFSHYRKEGTPTEIGWLWYHDVIYKPMSSRFSGNVRVAMFGTPSYQSRIYAFENNVLYAYSFPVYHNRGIRAYVNVRCRLQRKIDLWLRYATFIYRGVDEVGTGLNASTGNQRSELTVQLRIQFD
ncbi:helix-hairpin-helix domain-containing protein [Parapedobacter lycopersici]|uniref:helix-hairpin-helix domain-containing protein n=1 Tax=Parapedobacter lycopersici TaxID=1864939 RepID=UPI00214D2397|nr:helix-hairpin-helix domain-containing protein [Parapedobacter lycopersici]